MGNEAQQEFTKEYFIRSNHKRMGKPAFTLVNRGEKRKNKKPTKQFLKRLKTFFHFYSDGFKSRFWLETNAMISREWGLMASIIFNDIFGYAKRKRITDIPVQGFLIMNATFALRNFTFYHSFKFVITIHFKHLSQECFTEIL